MMVGLVVFYLVAGYVGLVLLLDGILEDMRRRRGHVPVIDPAWWAIYGAVCWALRLPGRALRWLRPRDTPRGLGGP